MDLRSAFPVAKVLTIESRPNLELFLARLPEGQESDFDLALMLQSVYPHIKLGPSPKTRRDRDSLVY